DQDIEDSNQPTQNSGPSRTDKDRFLAVRTNSQEGCLWSALVSGPQPRQIRKSRELCSETIPGHLSAERDQDGAPPIVLQFPAFMAGCPASHRRAAGHAAGIRRMEPGQIDERRLWRQIRSRLSGEIHEGDYVSRARPVRFVRSSKLDVSHNEGQ